jgi:hypothetical protein
MSLPVSCKSKETSYMTTKAKSFSKLAKKAIIRLSNAVGIKIGRHQPTDAVPKAIDEHLATLDPGFRSPLLSMFLGESQLGTDGPTASH